MQSPIPAARAADAAWLSSQIEKFIASEGKIERVPIGVSSNFNPIHAGPRQPDGFRPPRKHPDPKPKPPPRKLSAVELKRQQWTPVVLAKFDQGKTIDAIIKETGLGKTFVVGALNAAGRDTGANRIKKRDPVIIEKARQMAADRYSARYTAQILSTPEAPLSESTIRYLAEKNGFRFNGRTR